MIRTITTFTSPQSLKLILDSHYPLVTPEYYTPVKDDGVVYQHVPFNQETGIRSVICMFETEDHRNVQNQILETSFQNNYGKSFTQAMSDIGIIVETKILE